MKSKSPNTNAELIECLADLFDAVTIEGEAEAEEILRDAGLDPDAVGDRIAQFAKTTLDRSSLNWRQDAKVERENALAYFENYRQEQPPSVSDLKAQIAGILARQPNRSLPDTVRAHFYKLEHATSKDLESLLLELKFLEEQKGLADQKKDNEKE